MLMGSLMEKVMRSLELVDLSKQNFHRSLDSLQEKAHSILLLTVQWKEVETCLDSTKNILKEQAKELEALEDSIKVRALEVEKKEKDVCSLHGLIETRLCDLEKKRKELGLEHNAQSEKRKQLDAKEKELELKLKEVEQFKEAVSAKEKLRGEFEPLVSMLAKNMGSSLYMNENAVNLVKRNASLARIIPYLDPAKLVLDAIQGSCFGETDDRLGNVVDSCIVLLEKLIEMSLIITPKVKQEATQLGIDWIGKAKTYQNNNSSWVLGCLLFLAAYGLASITTPEVLLNLLERFLLYDQAPALFQLLGLEDKVSGVIDTLKKKEEYFAAIKFICEFRLSQLFSGAVLLECMSSAEKAGTGHSVEAQAKREKRKADAVMTLGYIKEKKLESWFPLKALRRMIALLERDESPQRAMKPVHESDEKGQSKTNTSKNTVTDSSIPSGPKKVKRQRLNEPINPTQTSTVKQPGSVSNPSGTKADELRVIHQEEAKAKNPLSTESKPSGSINVDMSRELVEKQPLEESNLSTALNCTPDLVVEEAKATNPLSHESNPKILSGSISADMLRELLEKQPLEESDLSSALKCTPDPAKLVLDTSMALCPTNVEGVYEFKLLITSASCSLLLDQLKKLSPLIGNPLKGDAKKFAVYWKDRLSKSKTDKLEVICFLHFVGIFRIVSEFKANDLLGLLDDASWQTVSPTLCQFLGLVDAIPGFIESLIITGNHLKAIDHIYSFDMVRRFQLVSAILNDFLIKSKESANKSFRDAYNEYPLQVAAIDKQIKDVRGAIRCISCHKLESEFPTGDLKEQIKSLEKRRKELSDGSKPELAMKESQIPKPRKLAKVGSVNASSSVSKPRLTKKNKRGQKRGNKHSSVHVASHSRNHVPGHDSVHQRLTYPVDHYNYDNHWTQPEGSQYYQLYQHHDPFYRNY